MNVKKKPERSQKNNSTLVNHFIDAMYVGVVSVVVDAEVLVDISVKYGATSDGIFECITSSTDEQLNSLLEKRSCIFHAGLRLWQYFSTADDLYYYMIHNFFSVI